MNFESFLKDNHKLPLCYLISKYNSEIMSTLSRNFPMLLKRYFIHACIFIRWRWHHTTIYCLLHQPSYPTLISYAVLFISLCQLAENDVVFPNLEETWPCKILASGSYISARWVPSQLSLLTQINNCSFI